MEAVQVTARRNTITTTSYFYGLCYILSLIVLLHQPVIHHALTLLPHGCHPVNRQLSKGIIIHGVYCDQEAYLEQIPSTFSSTINYMNISQNLLTNLTASSFELYPRLKYLILNHNAIVNIDQRTFEPLSNLIYLDMSANFIADLPPLPSSIETLYLNAMRNATFFFISNLTSSRIPLLTSLTRLSLMRNKVNVFPSFLKHLPHLTALGVSYCNITEISVNDIAPLCSLMEMDFTGNHLLNTEHQQCECLKVRKWAEEKNIRINSLYCPRGFNNKTCKMEILEEINTTCKMEFPESAIDAHFECRREVLLWKYGPIVAGLLLGIISMAICIGVYRYLQKRLLTPKSNVSAKYSAAYNCNLRAADEDAVLVHPSEGDNYDCNTRSGENVELIQSS